MDPYDALEHVINYHEYPLSVAAGYKNTKLIDWLFEKFIYGDEEIVNSIFDADQEGHSQNAYYLIDKIQDREKREDAISNLSISHNDIKKYTELGKRTPELASIMKAINRGHLEILKTIHEAKHEIPHVSNAAIYDKKINIVIWFVNIGHNLNYELFVKIFDKPEIELISPHLSAEQKEALLNTIEKYNGTKMKDIKSILTDKK